MVKYDLGIVGGGPAGYTAAFRAAKQGNKVILFEKDEVGGVCLNKGCIPTKTILHSSEIYKTAKNSTDFGINIDNATVDYNKVKEHKNVIVERLRKGLELAFKNSKIELVKEKAVIISNTEIEARGEIYSCSKIICATGSSPRVIKGRHDYVGTLAELFHFLREILAKAGVQFSVVSHHRVNDAECSCPCRFFHDVKDVRDLCL